MVSQNKTPDLETLNKRHKKTKKRVKELEADVAQLKEQARLVDQRTLRMSMALRQCMKKLGVPRPSGDITEESV